MRLSDQAIASVMVALQKGIMEQTDITNILRDFRLQFNEEDETLTVTNPPEVMKTENDNEIVNTVGSD